MKRRSSSPTDDSLELLLDTICNTFGGIIFISLLLALLIQTSSSPDSVEPTEGASVADLVEADARRERLSSELLRMRTLAESTASFAESLDVASAREAAQRLAEEQTRHAALVETKSAAVGASNGARIEIENAEAESEAIEKELMEAKEELAEAAKRAEDSRRTLAEAASERSAGATAPTLTVDESLGQVDWFVRYGRLYGPAIHPVGGVRNTADFEFLERDGVTYVRPRVGEGLAVAIDGSNVDAVARKLAVVSSRTHSVYLHVWPDSYREYDAIRLALEKNSFRTAVIPWEADDDLVLGGPQEKRRTQ